MPQNSADSAEMRCPGKMENIIVLGSEQSYDLFWFKMMFLSPGLGLAQGSLSVPHWTHADRTGNSSWRESFNSLAQAAPENSLAQRMATHCGVPFHAFYTRTLFAECIRDPSDSDSISAATARLRVGNEGSILNLSDEHEALPHAGQGTANKYVFFENGQIDEGTSEYSLWRKQGGRAMPVADNTPEGLSGVFAVFEP